MSSGRTNVSSLNLSTGVRLGRGLGLVTGCMRKGSGMMSESAGTPEGGTGRGGGRHRALGVRGSGLEVRVLG